MSESDEQAKVVRYCDVRGYPCFAIPNEGKRTYTYAQKLKRQGLRPGVPDLCIPVARGGYHSLYIEMKAKGGRVTDNQRSWIATLRDQGMAAFVCYGAESAIRCLEAYMGANL